MSLFESLKDVGKLLVGDSGKASIDNPVFKLHYGWTVSFLLAFSILLSLSQVKKKENEKAMMTFLVRRRSHRLHRAA